MASPTSGTGRIVEILDTEEKGSDVNLATYLVVDGYERDYEQAVIISNDSDLAFPIAVVRERLGFPVGIVNPDPEARTHRELKEAATFERRIRENALRACQFPATLRDAHGTITKPDAW